MRSHSKILVLILILASVTLSACGPDANASPSGDDPGDGLDSLAATARAEEGQAEINYSYNVQHPHIKFDIGPTIGVSFEESTPGNWNFTGIGQTYATLEMAGGSGGDLCWFECEMLLRFTVDGKVELDDFNNDCMLPVVFNFVATNDESILTGDCPEQLMAVVDCAALSVVMVNPSVFTFTKEIRELDLPAEQGVIMQAEIEDVVMPKGLEGICNW